MEWSAANRKQGSDLPTHVSRHVRAVCGYAAAFWNCGADGSEIHVSAVLVVSRAGDVAAGIRCSGMIALARQGRYEMMLRPRGQLATLRKTRPKPCP